MTQTKKIKKIVGKEGEKYRWVIENKPFYVVVLVQEKKTFLCIEWWKTIAEFAYLLDGVRLAKNLIRVLKTRR